MGAQTVQAVSLAKAEAAQARADRLAVHGDTLTWALTHKFFERLPGDVVNGIRGALLPPLPLP
jgi:hypothetical protein